MVKSSRKTPSKRRKPIASFEFFDAFGRIRTLPTAPSKSQSTAARRGKVLAGLERKENAIAEAAAREALPALKMTYGEAQRRLLRAGFEARRKRKGETSIWVNGRHKLHLPHTATRSPNIQINDKRLIKRIIELTSGKGKQNG